MLRALDAMWIWVLASLIFVLVVWLLIPSKQVVARGTFDSLELQFKQLIDGLPKQRILRVEMPNGVFLQFEHAKNSVQMDFPLISEQHKDLESTYRKEIESLGFHVKEATGSDGARFLDVNLSEDISELVELTKKIFTGTFGALETTKLKMVLLP